MRNQSLLRRYLAISACLFAFSACGTAWHQVTSDDGRFSILMPGAPTIVASDGGSDSWAGEVWTVDTGRQAWLLKPRTAIFYWARAQDLPKGWTAEAGCREVHQR
jgi:hypothetical protein